MALLEELKIHVAGIVRSPWNTRVGQKVPLSQDIGLGNDAVTLDGAVLYADMTKSTQLVDHHQAEFAAEVYKAYLGCAAKIIRSNNGSIAAYDGDRIMAVFHGKNPNVRSIKSALEINYAVHNLVGPAFESQYPNHGYEIAHTIGVDSGGTRTRRPMVVYACRRSTSSRSSGCRITANGPCARGAAARRKRLEPVHGPR